jgi:hypothetical protein
VARWFAYFERPDGVTTRSGPYATKRKILARVRFYARDERQRARLRRIGAGAYEYFPPFRERTHERVYIYTRQGAELLVPLRCPVQRLLWPNAGGEFPSPLRSELRAR